MGVSPGWTSPVQVEKPPFLCSSLERKKKSGSSLVNTCSTSGHLGSCCRCCFNSPDLLLFPERASDEMESLYNHLKAARLSPMGQSSQRDFRASFIRRCKNDQVNEKLHLVRILRSTLKVNPVIDSVNT